MKSFRRWVWIAAAFSSFLIVSQSASAASGSVTPVAQGYAYGIDRLYFYQYTPSLQLVSSESLYSMGLKPVYGVEGGAISTDGLFVTEAYINDATKTSGYSNALVGIGAGGVVQRSIEISESQQTGNGLGVDPTSGTIYATYVNHLYSISPSFSTATQLPFTFGEAGGVAVSATGTVYVVDSSGGRIDILNSNETGVAGTIPAGTDPLGIAFGPDGTLFYSEGSYYGQNACDILGVNLATGAQALYASGLPELDSLDVAPDGSMYAASGSKFLHITGGTYQSVSTGNNTGAIAFAPVPEPTSTALIGVALAGQLCRRRTRKR